MSERKDNLDWDDSPIDKIKRWRDSIVMDRAAYWGTYLAKWAVGINSIAYLSLEERPLLAKIAMVSMGTFIYQTAEMIREEALTNIIFSGVEQPRRFRDILRDTHTAILSKINGDKPKS